MAFFTSDVVTDCYLLGNWPGGGNTVHVLIKEVYYRSTNVHHGPCGNSLHKDRVISGCYNHLPSDSNQLLRHSWKTPSTLATMSVTHSC